MNGLAGCYVSTIGKPHEYFDLTGSQHVIAALESTTRDVTHQPSRFAQLDLLILSQIVIVYRSGLTKGTLKPFNPFAQFANRLPPGPEHAL